MYRSNKIHQKLIDAYWKSYWSADSKKAWVSNIELSAIQLRYSARIHELREAGIKVQTESDGEGGFRYRLLTNPDTIDWDSFKAKISQEPIRKAPSQRFLSKDQQPSLFGSAGEKGERDET